MLDLSDQPLDLLSVHEQLARSHGIRHEVRRYRGQRRDMRPDQPELPLAHENVGVAELDPPGADGLDLPALEGEAGLEPLLDEVIVECFSILGDGHEGAPARAVIVAAGRAAP